MLRIPCILELDKDSRGQQLLNLHYNLQGPQGIFKRLKIPCVHRGNQKQQFHFWKSFQSNWKHLNYDIANKTHKSLQRYKAEEAVSTVQR